MKRILSLLLAGALAVICAACRPAAPTMQPGIADAEPERYSLQDGSVIDRDGNPIEEAKRFQVIYEWDTGRAQAKYLRRMEDTGKRDEYGNPVVKHLSALYDMEENLLCDWDEVDYESGFDDYIVRREVRRMDMMEEIKPGFARGLWSLTENKLALPEAVSVEKYDDNSYLVSDNMGRLLGRIDRKLNPIGEYPLTEHYYNASVWGSYISVTTENPYQWYEDQMNGATTEGVSTADAQAKPDAIRMDRLLTPDYQVVLEKETLSASFYQACSEKLVMYREKGMTGLYSMPENRSVATFENGVWLNYYDDEVVMPRIEKANYSSQNDRFTSWLQSIDGTRLTTDYQMMEPVREKYSSYDDTTPANAFIGVWDGKVELLDRKGKVTAQVELPDVVAISPQGEAGFSYTVELRDAAGKVLTDEWGNAQTREGLLDRQLRVIIPAEKYQYLQVQYGWRGGEIDDTRFLSGYYMLPSNQIMRSDLLDTSGNLIAGQLTTIGSIGDDRVQVTKGFEEGLINFKGEWIYKQSLFGALEDE